MEFGVLLMICIGILAAQNSQEIANALVTVMKSKHQLTAVKYNNPNIENEIKLFEYSGIDYALILFDRYEIYPVNLDILILDNPENKRIVSYDLLKCIKEHTIVIYNTDNGYLPYLDHPNAIDYGLNSSSAVSVSSVNYFFDSHISFIVSVQRELSGLFSTLPIGEVRIDSDSSISISNQIPAVICALVCGLIDYLCVKI